MMSVPRNTYFPDSPKRCPICGEGVDPNDKRRKYCCDCRPPQHRPPEGMIVYYSGD
jgi:hypothetical protein